MLDSFSFVIVLFWFLTFVVFMYRVSVLRLFFALSIIIASHNAYMLPMIYLFCFAEFVCGKLEARACVWTWQLTAIITNTIRVAQLQASRRISASVHFLPLSALLLMWCPGPQNPHRQLFNNQLDWLRRELRTRTSSWTLLPTFTTNQWSPFVRLHLSFQASRNHPQ